MKLLSMIVACVMGVGACATVAISAATVRPYILFIYVPGGWDSTMVFDSKVGNTNFSQESGARLARGKGDIAYVDHSSRPSVKAFFDAYGDQISVINGVYTGGFNHKEAQQKLMNVAVNKSGVVPIDWLAYYATAAGGGTFPYVCIDAPFVGGAYGHNSTFLTSNQLLEIYFADQYPSLSETQSSLISELQITHLNNILSRYESVSLAQMKLLSWRNNFLKISSLRSVVKARLTGLQFETSPMLRSGKFAINLFSAGVSKVVAISADSSPKWDTHSDHYTSQSALFEKFFDDLKTILDYAAANDLSDNLTIIVASEMGRSPVFSNSNGKGHWPYSSWMVMGPRINGVSVIGLTDSIGRGVPINPLFGTALESGDPIEPKNIAASILLAYGVSYAAIMGSDVLPLSVMITKE